MANKVLFFLPADNKWARIARRFVAILIFGKLSVEIIDFIQNSGNLISDNWFIILNAVLAALDKALREIKNKNKEEK
jgi:hypothetical protein